jgi:hypothetical protein
LELIKDQPPVIAVQSPKPNTLIEPWMRSESQVSVNVSDDYGIGNAFIAATIASGSGEAVKFKQQQLPFPGFSAGNNQYRLQKLIDLKALGMKRGDELYFYISAADNHGQEKRSDMYIVRIEDTAQLLSIEGLASGLDIKPEFFRSQRQIIIETEQLLREKDTISVSEFNRRSNNLGIDQKLLRLRYSKFLGEEDSEGAHDDAGAFTSPEDFNNAAKILDEVTHKHDIAEDATFFDPETKKQLKATLAEMWKSELQLRTIKPKDALPFEYAALRLLKELQQSSRVYVAKTGVKTPPLKPEKRLTGDLDKISSFMQQQTYQPDQADIIARKALGVLEQVRSGEALTADGRSILEQALIPLSQQAAAMPSVYLMRWNHCGASFSKTSRRRISQLPGAACKTFCGLQIKHLTGPIKPQTANYRNAILKISIRYMTDMHYIAIGISLVLLAWLVWQEIRRPNKGRLILRLLATVLALGSFICLFLPLNYTSTNSVTADIVLLTPGFNKDSVAALSREKKTALPVYVADAAMREAAGYRPLLFTAATPFNGTMHVFGEGLSRDILAEWKIPRIIFHPSPITGVTDVYWPKQIASGSSWQVSGIYNNVSNTAVKISLSSFGAGLDSIMIPAKSKKEFRLATIPRQIGRFVYQLTVMKNRDTLQKEPVPLIVHAMEPPAVLLLASSPDFENKFLKNWLAEKGYPVMVRTATSRGKFSKEYLNTSSIDIDRLGSAVLEKAAIIIADAQSIASLSSDERDLLFSSVRNKGKGYAASAGQ